MIRLIIGIHKINNKILIKVLIMIVLMILLLIKLYLLMISNNKIYHYNV